jgi:metal-responsive CopG/Arc/MetJ family transcriptional regulator
MFMKTAISIPDSVFEAAEQLAQRLGMSRSRLYSEAVEQFVADHRRRDTTDRLNAIYRDEPARVDTPLQTLQTTSLDSEDW